MGFTDPKDRSFWESEYTLQQKFALVKVRSDLPYFSAQLWIVNSYKLCVSVCECVYASVHRSLNDINLYVS